MSLKRLLYGGIPQIGGGSYQSVVLSLAPSSLVAYWPLTETSGTQANDVSGNARHGIYSGVTLAQIAGPGASMGSAPLFDGVNDFIDVFSASLGGAFSAATGTLAVWIRVLNAGIWTDGTFRYVFEVWSSNTNRYLLYKSTGTNLLRGELARGGTSSVLSMPTSSVAWLHAAMTWDTGANQLIGYLAGVPTAPIAIGGIFAGAISSARIGSYTGGTSFWSGYLAHCAFWSATLTPAQITTLATAR